MAAGFHAFRNIGFSFVKAEATCRKWREKFTGFDGASAADRIGLRREDAFVYVPYFGKQYRLCSENGVLEKLDEQENEWIEDLFMNEALIVYHYLGDRKEKPRCSGTWVPEHTLDPVLCKSDHRTNPLLGGFADAFSGQTSLLDRCCLAAGGVRVKTNADAAWEFETLKNVPLRVLYWEPDEDFAAQVQVMADRYATDFVHYEVLGFLMADLFVRIDEIRKKI